MDNHINQRLSPSCGFFEIIRHIPAEASKMPIANISNTTENHGRSAMQEKTSVTAQIPQTDDARAIKHHPQQREDVMSMKSSSALSAHNDESEEGYKTPEERISARSGTPSTPDGKNNKISTSDRALKSKKSLFSSLSSAENASAVSDSSPEKTVTKKPR